MMFPNAVASAGETRVADGVPEKVLIAEDDPMFRRILQSWLERWGYCVRVSEDGTAAWDIVQQERPPEMLLLDWVMPGISGIELCRRIRDRQASPYQYILLLTGKEDKRDVVAGLEAGADDYLIKPFNQDELRARLHVGLRILDLQRKLIGAREELRIQATHDALTGLWNRSAILNLLSRELSRGARSQMPIGVLMLDLDHFKKVNDTYGHLVGDEVLQEAANRISKCLRSYDILGRFGGEEFLALIPECDRSHVEETANRIRLAVCCTPILTSGTAIPVSVSIGATLSAGEESSHKSLTAADQALYQAKNSGRNRVSVLL